MGEYSFVWQCLVAGLLASLACGLGAVPLWLPGVYARRRIGVAYAATGGLMVSASFYNLLMPALRLGHEGALELGVVASVVGGLLAGSAMMWGVQVWVARTEHSPRIAGFLEDRVSMLVFAAMTIHSIPEGVAVGVGYAAEGADPSLGRLGSLIALAIGIHNIPEGLAVALPLRAAGASFWKCFWAAFLTSLPQPIAAVPAALLAWFFQPLMPPMLGFAAGAMIYLVVVELIPDALETRTPTETAWAFMLGFALMVLVQASL